LGEERGEGRLEFFGEEVCRIEDNLCLSSAGIFDPAEHFEDFPYGCLREYRIGRGQYWKRDIGRIWAQSSQDIARTWNS
jgi:hypothetical protein